MTDEAVERAIENAASNVAGSVSTGMRSLYQQGVKHGREEASELPAEVHDLDSEEWAVLVDAARHYRESRREIIDRRAREEGSEILRASEGMFELLGRTERKVVAVKRALAR